MSAGGDTIFNCKHGWLRSLPCKDCEIDRLTDLLGEAVYLLGDEENGYRCADARCGLNYTCRACKERIEFINRPEIQAAIAKRRGGDAL